jgi:UDP-N-acetylenolpyruvoylglucosamine reductase
MKVNIVKGNGVKTVEEIRTEKMEMEQTRWYSVGTRFKQPRGRLRACRSSAES